MSKTFKVYLAGPIAGHTFDEAQNWRDYAAKRIRYVLSEDGVKCYSPLRYKRRWLPTDETLTFKPYDAHPMTTSRGIMVRDHYDTISADLVLVNLLGAKSISIGTAMEMAFAYTRQIPVVLVMEKEGNPHDGHAMLMEAYSYRFDDLNDALDMVVDFLLP